MMSNQNDSLLQTFSYKMTSNYDPEKINNFRQGLPIFQYKSKIQQTVAKNNFCVVTGDTGSGKSTQLPQYMMDSSVIAQEIKAHQGLVEQYMTGKIDKIDQINVITTQPRRVAAMSMANRVCYERNCQLGTDVGYTIRFDDKTTNKTRLKYITDGIFVRQCINDPYLFRYHVVILDQAHERSLYTDVLFALIKKAVHYRKGTLKLIVTSATLNTKTFSKYFQDCPVIHMHGKLYPVEVKYFPIQQSLRVEECVKAAIRMHLHQGPGDILAFLTGSEQCEAAVRLCYDKLDELMQKGRQVPGMIIYQLYGALSNEDQARVFEPTPQGIRKVVFSTNIAQTSLTIDNIGFVIDTGFVKQKNYNPKTNMDSLVTVPLSKVQAIQRKGRAGRTQEGKCLRLYSQKFYQQMKDYSLPEILRVSLNNVVLTLKSMRITDVINFEYIESPDKQAIFKALSELFLLSAIDENGAITQLGQQMSKFPLDPQYSKAVITSKLYNIQDDMITLVSMLSTQSIWKKVLRINQQDYQMFQQQQKKFLAESGDHETYLNVFAGWMTCDKPQEFCDENFLNFRALRQADNIKNQLHEILTNCRVDICQKYYRRDTCFQQYLNIKEKYTKIPQEYTRRLLRISLCPSFYFNTARISANQTAYLLNYPDGTVAVMDPTSSLALQNVMPRHVIFTQLGGSGSRAIMRTLSMIDKKWIDCYLPLTQKIDNFRLAGIVFNSQRKIQQKQQESQEAKQKRLLEERQRKIQEAKQRYLARKKVKLV